MTQLTQEDINFIAKTFGLKPVKTAIGKNQRQIKDGVATKGDTVWWARDGGPDQVKLEDDSRGTHWSNSKKFPNLYSFERPRTRTIYLQDNED